MNVNNLTQIVPEKMQLAGTKIIKLPFVFSVKIDLQDMFNFKSL